MDKWLYVMIIIMILVGGAESITWTYATNRSCPKCIEKDVEISKLKNLIIEQIPKQMEKPNVQ
jgi:hypothetical protein